MDGSIANKIEKIQGSLSGYKFKIVSIQIDLESGQAGTLKFNPIDYVPNDSSIISCIDSIPQGWYGVYAEYVRKSSEGSEVFPWIYNIKSAESGGVSPFRIMILIIYN